MERLSNKQRFYIILAAVILLAWVSFKFAFVRTIDLKQQIKDTQLKIETTREAPVKLKQMQSRLAELDEYLHVMPSENASSQLVETVGILCQTYNLFIREIPEKHIFTNNQYQITTYQFTVEGSFKGLIQLLNDMEHNPSIGKIKSCSLETQLDFITGQKHLLGKYFLQSVSKTKLKSK